MSHPSPMQDYSYNDTQAFDVQSNEMSYDQEGIDSWEQLMGETNHRSLSRSSHDRASSLGFQRTTEELDPQIDYETIIRSKNLYYDPQPEVIRKNMSDNSMVYTQNILVRFLQPPPVEHGPLIIREIRPPQPPPPPPLVFERITLLILCKTI